MTDPEPLPDETEGDGSDRFRHLPPRAQPEDFTTSQAIVRDPEHDRNPEREDLLRLLKWGGGGV